MYRVAVAIPALNARETIGEVITGVSQFVPASDIFVVDDGSSDETEMIARQQGVWVLRHAARRGKGAALRDAVRKILELNYDSIITLDSDLQHDPAEIPAFVSASERFDVVIGKRMISSNRMPIHRFMSNSITTKMISIRTGVRIDDSQCGYRLYKTEVLKAVHSHRRHYDYESEILIKSALAGFKIGFVPIKTIYNGSKSSIKVMDIIRFIGVYLASFAEPHD